MAIPLFNEIEKLINEHGSAVILKERLALAADQYAALERKIIEIEARAKQSESENKSLRLNLDKAEEKIRNLEKELVTSHGHPQLEEIKIKILLLISEYEEAYTQQIASKLGIGLQTALFHLEELQENKMVGDT